MSTVLHMRVPISLAVNKKYWLIYIFYFHTPQINLDVMSGNDYGGHYLIFKAYLGGGKLCMAIFAKIV